MTGLFENNIKKQSESTVEPDAPTANTRAVTARELASIKIDTAPPYNVTGSAADLLNSVGGLTSANADRAGIIQVTGWTTVVQAKTLQLWADGNTTVSYNIQDTASSLASLKAGVAAFAVNINATTVATIAEANTIAAFKNSGTTGFSVTGTATALLTKTTGLSDLAGQKVSLIQVNGTATVSQVSQLTRWSDADTTITYSLKDTSSSLASASASVLGGAQTVTASDPASVQQAQSITLVTVGKTFVYSIKDTASSLAQMDATLGASATAISATTTATIAEANAIAAFTNKGNTVFSVSGTAAGLLDPESGLSADAAEKADQIDVTGDVTADQADALQRWNDGDTLVTFNISDSVDAVSRLSSETGDAATDIRASGEANVEQANHMASFSNSGEISFNVSDTAGKLTDKSSGLDAAASVEADLIQVLDSATVAQATLISSWADKDTVVQYSISDTPAALASASKGVILGATDLTATTATSIAEANTIANFSNSGETSFTVEATAADLTRIRTGLSAKAANEADQIVVTDAASVSQANKIQGWADADTQVIYDLADQPDLLADAGSPILTGARKVTVSDVATVEQITAIVAAGELGNISYSLMDSPLSLIGADISILNQAVNIELTSPVSAADAQLIAVTNNSGTIKYSLSDTPESLAGLPQSIGDGAIDVQVSGKARVAEANIIADWNHGGSTQMEIADGAREITHPVLGLSLRAANLASLIQVEGTASVFQAAQIESWADTDTTVIYSLEDTADALANAGRAALSGATDIIATDSADVTRAAVIAGAANSGTTRYHLEDTAANLVAADAAILDGATNITVRGQIGTKEVTLLEAAANSGILTYHLSDTASALAGAGDAILNGAGDIVATEAASATEATILQAAANSGKTVYDVRDTASRLASLDPVVGDGARDVVVTDEATTAEANTITGFANSGSTRFEVADTAAAITSKVSGLQDLAADVAIDITVTDTASVQQALQMVDWADEDTTVRYDLQDTAKALSKADSAVSAFATDVIATDTASVVEANTIAAFLNSGTTTFTVTGKASDLTGIATLGTDRAARRLAESGAGLTDSAAEEASEITATGTATVAQATRIQSWTDDDTRVVYSIKDTAARLITADAAVLLEAKDITITDGATVRAATAILANGVIERATYSLSDSASNLVVADTGLLNRATNITATGLATVQDALVLNAATNSGTLTYHLGDTASALAGAGDRTLNGAGDIIVTGAATAAEATLLQAATNSGKTIYDLRDTASRLADLDQTVGGGAHDIVVTGQATTAQANIITGFANDGSTKFEVADTANALTSNVSGLSDLATEEAFGITVTDSASVQQVSTLLGWADEDTTVHYSLQDTAKALANIDSAQGNAAINISATDTVSIAQANTIAGFSNSGSTAFNVVGTSADLTDLASGLNQSAQREADQITATDAANVEQATRIKSWADTDTLVSYALRDTASQIVTAQPAVLNGASSIAISDAASVKDILSLKSATSNASISYSLSDSAPALAAGSKAIGDGSLDINVQGTANTSEANAISAFSNKGLTSLAIADSPSNLTGIGNTTTITFDFYRIDSWDNEAFQIYNGKDLVLSQTFQWGTNVTTPLSGKGVNSTWTMTPTTAGNVNQAFSGWSDQKFSVTLTMPIVNSLNLRLTSTLNQDVNDESWGIDNFRVSLGSKTVSYEEFASNTEVTGWSTGKFTNTWGGFLGRYSINESVSKTLKLTSLTGSDVNGLSTTTLGKAGLITATEAATAEQASRLQSWNTSKTTVIYNIVDSVSNLIAASPMVLNAATDITANGDATVKQATILDAATNNGITLYNLNDTASNLAAVAETAILNSARDMVASSNATVKEATLMEAATNNGATRYSVSDTVTALIEMAPAAGNGAINLTATDTAIVVQANTIAAFTNSGNTAFNVADTAAALTDANTGLTAAAAGEADSITVVGTATAQQAAVIRGWADADTKVKYSISDSSTLLAAASTTTLNGAVDIVATDRASVSQATLIEAAANTGVTTYSLEDTPAALILASKAVGDGATDIMATATTSIAEANAIAAFNNPGITTFNVAGTAKALTESSNLAPNTTITFDFYRIDSWDNEQFQVYSGKDLILNQTFQWGTNVTTALTGKGVNSTWTMTPTTAGNANQAFAGWSDQKFSVSITLPTTTTLSLRMTSTLNQDVNDESWGIDNLKISSASTVISSEDFARASAVTHWNTGKFDATWGGFLGRYARGESAFKAFTNPAANVGLSTQAAREADTITVTDAATVSEATKIQGWDSVDTLVVYSIKDTAAAVASAAVKVLNSAVDIIATGNATVKDAGAILAATNSGLTTYNMGDTAANLVQADPAVLNGAADITVIGISSVSDASLIRAALKGGNVNYSLSDSADQLAKASPDLLNSAKDIMASGLATVAEAAVINSAFNKGITSYSIEDSGIDLASASLEVLNGATDIQATDKLTAEQASYVESASNSGKTVYSLSDTAQQLALTKAQVLNGSVDITVTDMATAVQAGIINDAINTGKTLYSIRDTASSLASVSNATGSSAVDLVLTTAANTTEANTIAAFTNSGIVSFQVSDTGLALLNGVKGLSGIAAEEANDITATGTVTVAQADKMSAWVDEDTSVHFNLGDTAASLVAARSGLIQQSGDVTVIGDARVVEANRIAVFANTGETRFSVADTIQALTDKTAGLNAEAVENAQVITTAGTASVAQIGEILGWSDEDTVVKLTYNLSDTAAHLAEADTKLLDGAVDITATDAVTVAQATRIEQALNSGKLGYSISDSPEALAGASLAALNNATDILSTAPLTVEQALVINQATNVGSKQYDLQDTASTLVLARSAASINNAGKTVATTVASASEANVLAGFSSTSTVAATKGSIQFEVSGTASALLDEVSGLSEAALEKAARISVIGPVTIGQAQRLLAWADSDTVLKYDLSADASTLSGADIAVLNGASNITVTGTATVAQASLIDVASNSGTLAYSLNDTVSALAGAQPGLLDGATDITASGMANSAQVPALLAAKNSGETTLDSATLNAESAVLLEYDTTGNDTLKSLTVTGIVNVAEATLLLEDKAAGNLLALSYGITDSIENVVAASQDVITGASSLVIVEGLADYGFNTDQILPLGGAANVSDKLRAVDITAVSIDEQDVLVTANAHTLRVLGKNQLDGSELLFADGSLLKLGGLVSDVINGGNTIDTGDYLLGGGGNDKIRGLSGEDKLYGGAGSDILYGGKGRDTVWGGLDNDLLYGGSGSGDDGSTADHFVYQYGVNEGRDIIAGFDTVRDKLVIQGGGGYSNAVFSVTANGNSTIVTLKQPDGSAGTVITLMGVSSSSISPEGSFAYA